MHTETLLIIDDDKELCALLEEFLVEEGFQVEMRHNGVEGAEAACTGNYALVVLDVMMPGCNGFEALQKIRKQNDTPVLMLTARSDEVDRIVGLEMGADDYLAKPFNPRELVARIRAIFRRTRALEPLKERQSEIRKILIGDLEMDPATRRVFRQGQAIDLTAVEFNLLHTLLLSAGKVVSRENLNQAVLGREYSPLDRSIDVHVSKLRKKLKIGDQDDEMIKAIRGEGYFFAPNSD